MHSDNDFRALEKAYFAALKASGKPSWDAYFMRHAILASSRSIDPDTKHGCVIVSSQNRPLSMGYNGPLQGIDDAAVPLARPLKYDWLLHSEMNALLFCTAPMDGASAYITGFPCNTCFKAMVQRGVKTIVYGDTVSACISRDEISAIESMASMSGVSMRKFDFVEKE